MFDYIVRNRFEKYTDIVEEIDCKIVPNKEYVISLFLLYDKYLFNYSDCNLIKEFSSYISTNKSVTKTKSTTTCTTKVVIEETAHWVKVSSGGSSETYHNYDSYDIIISRHCVSSGEEIQWPLGGGGGPSTSPKIKIDSTFKDNPCASEILTSLKSGQSSLNYNKNTGRFIGVDNLTASILKFFTNSDTLNVTYKIGPIKGNGYCNRINKNNYNYEIIIDDYYASTATNLSIARTIIHETIHAHLLYVTYAMTNEEKKNSKEWIALNEIFYGPLAGDQENNTIQHEYMTGIVNLISDNLYQWANVNNINVDRTYCLNLAWGGLQETQIYQSKVKNRELDNVAIIKTLLKEQNNELNAKGKPCTE